MAVLVAAAWLSVGLAAAALAAPQAPVLKRFETQGPIWSLAAAEGGLILGEVPQRVVVATGQGRELRSFDVGGLPLALATGRLAADGPEVVVVAAQDASGSIYCLANEPEGLRLLWKFSARNPFLSVALGDVDGDGKAEIAAGSYAGLLCVLDASGKLKWRVSLDEASSVGALSIGDLDGEGAGEVVAGTSDGGVFALSGTGQRLWRLGTRLPGMKTKKEGLLWVRSVHVTDLQGDGKNEVAVGSRPSGMVTVLAGDGKLLWRKNFPEVVNRWSTALVEPADLNGDGRKELACLLHGIVFKAKGTSPLMILDSGGNLLSASQPEVNLFCLGSADLDGNGRRQLILGSPTRGRGFYVVDYPGGLSPISLARPKDNLDGLVAAVGKMPPRPLPAEAAAKERPIRILVPVKFREIRKKAASLARYLRSLEGPGLKFELMITAVNEKRGKLRDGFRPPRSARRRGRNLFSREEIVAAAKYLESQKLPFYVQAAKICLPAMRAATCEAILAAAPTQCRGFLVNENAPTRVSKFESYIVWAQQVMDACHRRGDKKFIMDEFLNFWSAVPAEPRYFAALFKPAYRNVAVPMYKTNQPVAPEQQLGMILGLWKAGVVAEWGFCTEDDLWKWESFFMNPPHDVLLRLDVMAAVLGATYFRIEENREFIEAKGASYRIEEGARRHRDLFQSLVRKGAIRPAQDEAEVLVSPVVLKKAESGLGQGRDLQHRQFWQHAFEGQGTWAFRPLLQAVRDDYPFSYLYQMRHGYDGLFPETPYGPVAILPDHLDAKNIAGTRSAWSLGAGSVRGPDGKLLSSDKVRQALRASFVSGAAELPLTAEGCLTVIRKQPGGYLVYLIDSGHFDVSDRQVTLKVARPEAVAGIADVISGEKLEIVEKKVKLQIPAGTFRIVELRLKPATGGK